MTNKITQKEQILITCDSTCDLSPALLKQYNIKVLPLHVILGNRIYTDNVDISPEMIYAHYEKTKELPKTSAVNFADAKAFFERYTAEGYTIIHFAIGSTLSSTYQHCHMAARAFEHVFVIDTQTLTSGVGLLAIHAAELAAQGKSAEEIVTICTDIRNTIDVSFVVNDLEFLQKGGRCSSLEAFGANLLHLKPCIVVRNGKMIVGHKYRGKFDVILKRYITEQLHNTQTLDLNHIFITHGGCDKWLCQECVKTIKEIAPFCHVHITTTSCTVASHCGRNTLGIIFLRK